MFSYITLTPCSNKIPFNRNKKLSAFSQKLNRRVAKPVRCQQIESEELVPANLIGIHGNVWVGGSSNEEIAQAMKCTKEAGFDLIEIPMFHPEEADGDFIKDQLKKYELESAMSLGLTPDTDISSEDNEIVSKGIEKLKLVIDLASESGTKFLVGVLYSAINKYPHPPTALNRSNAIKALKELDTYIQDKGITMGLEVINRYESNLLNTAQDGVEFLLEGDFKNIGLHLDTFHINIEESSMAHAVQVAGPDLEYMHVGESHRGYMGSGTINWKQLFDTLVQQEYLGPITFESFSSRVVSNDLSNNLCVWRDLWDDSMDLAKHARSFIDVHMKAAEISVMYNGDIFGSAAFVELESESDLGSESGEEQ